MTIRTGAFYQAFKYAVYVLLTINTGHFFLENLAGSDFVFTSGLGLSDVIVAYTDAIDTAAWLVLLLILELETFVIPDERLKGWVSAIISIVSFICWAAIIYSFYGYVATLEVPYGFAHYAGPDPCALAGTGASFARTLGEYAPLDAENCRALASGAIFSVGDNMFTTPENLKLITRLAWLDVVNSAVWLLVVVILELEIYLQSSKLVGTRFFAAYKSFKVFLYLVLAVNLIYWWMLDEPWGAWDAFLWLVAFFFIEMNLLSWQEETAEHRAAGETA